MSDIAIKVENLSKYYKLGVINNGTLFKDIQSYIARLRGKEDPNGKIGAKHIDNTEGFWALKDLNFEIKKGDRVGIIGHNGAGKSTLLKVLSQITSPTEGNIKINGRIASLLEVGTGFHPELTGRENIYMNGAILGMKKSEIDKKVDQIIEFSEIGDHIDTPVKRYSSGMYVRLAFAVAAHLDSEILIADEVLAVGDAAFQKKALGKMNELSTGEGRTVLFVSHQMNAVKQLCNKGIVLEKGNIIRQDDDIEDSVNWYLGLGESLEKPESWNNKEFGNNFFFPRKIYCIDSNKLKKNVFTSDEEAYIAIDYIIKEKNSLLVVALDLYSESGTLIYGTSLRDATDFDKIKVGEGTFYIKIPTNILNYGEYGIRISAVIKDLSYIIPPGFSAPVAYFAIKGVDSSSFIRERKRPGEIIQLIEWKDRI